MSPRQVPLGWTHTTLSQIARVKTGTRNNQDKVPNGRYPFFVRSATVERIDSYGYDCEAILVPGEGGIGNIFHYVNGKFEVHQRVYKLSDFSTNVSGRFLYYYMVQFFGPHALENSVKATVDSLRLPTFLNFPVTLPESLSEQQAITRALDEADELVAVQETLLAKKRDIALGLAQELLSGRARLPGFSGAWRETSLSEVGVGVRGVGYNPDVDLASSRTPWTFELLRSNNVQDGQLALNDTQHVRQERVRSEQVLRRGDILICAANGSRQLVGKSAYIELDATRRFTFGAFMAVFRADASKADAYFVSKLMQSQHYRNYIDVLLSGSSINNLSPKQVVTYVALTPPLAEQQAIASVLRDADAEIGWLEAQLAKTRAIKQGMMQELLTGKTRLPVGAVA